ncbi:dienelactone hydrolase endo-1,3,1,4-beta-D-glucanase [Mycena polygramma]|nr:dienelactone hydrolase endo-1,3,1,4-beta-D-glucanase [Mycena polygramma]
MSLCNHCVKGERGTPAGLKLETIGGIESYVATPTGDYPKDKIILFLSDAFGVTLVNNQLLADGFAENGLKNIIPDILHGDPVPANALDPGVSTPSINVNFDVPKWFEGGHYQADTHPIIDKVVEALKANGVKRFAAVGYCFGGRYVFDLAFDNIISLSAVAHPSGLEVPTDLEKYVTGSKAPLLINSCSDDPPFAFEAQAKAYELFAGFAPGYEREFFDGCKHGFAVRGDLGNPKDKAGMEGAFTATVEWFKQYL